MLILKVRIRGKPSREMIRRAMQTRGISEYLLHPRSILPTYRIVHAPLPSETRSSELSSLRPLDLSGLPENKAANYPKNPV